MSRSHLGVGEIFLFNEKCEAIRFPFFLNTEFTKLTKPFRKAQQVLRKSVSFVISVFKKIEILAPLRLSNSR